MSSETSTPRPRPSVVIVIPTANRATLAIEACRSLLVQPGVNITVLVSDNSTIPDNSAMLERFCRDAGDPRLIYVRPDTHLPMPTHWDWAIGRALADTQASHLMIHYDRKITKPRALSPLLDASARFPDRLITYAVDQVGDMPVPYTLWAGPWTGRLYSVRSARVLEMVAAGEINEMGCVLPILSNCVVPRGVMLAIRERFGTFCDSTGPDSCFTFRFSALFDDFVCCDRTIGVLYASHRSTGLGYVRQAGGDFPAFMAAWGDRPWIDAAPIPGLSLGHNLLFHEYELVRREMGPGRFPSIDHARYLSCLAAGLPYIQNNDLRQRMRQVLETHGLPPIVEPVGEPTPAVEPVGKPPVSVLRRVRRRAMPQFIRLCRHPSTRWFWKFVGVSPWYVAGMSFRSDDDALQFAVRARVPRVTTHAPLVALQALALPE